ncbi:hypothetical protein QBC38DRAFT_487777 [Podospora fimiseda]|uniref:Uncharacterized protein n=1 Tax=Podospora fimiseda TaxID=252190 RepID=A0AAN7BHI8_9PEZI|nr:hypothetical protein QBC38DRAFT_487777 [Podospora fimiseda]
MLRAHEYAVPKTFYFLVAVAAFTLLLLTLTSILSLCKRLRPVYSLVVSFILASLWVASFAVVLARLRNVLFSDCSADKCATDAGISLCYLIESLLVLFLLVLQAHLLL